MNTQFLLQFAGSGLAIGALVLLVAWARIARPNSALDEAGARALFAEEFPGRSIDGVWVSADGAGALARAGGDALVICRVGDGYAARSLPWARALASNFGNGRLRLELGEVGAPRAVLALEAWPPKELAA